MGEQGNTGEEFISHGMSQQSYSLGSMDIMDEMTVGGIGNSPEDISELDRTVGSLGPIFPPQNFEVPDISFSNSVSPNADFNQSLLGYGNSSNIFTKVGASAGHVMEGQSVGLHKQQQGQMSMSGQQMSVGGQRQMPYFPPASQSPPGTSSSDDSDDLPLAQLAKRVVSTTNAASVASPSAPSTDTTSMEGSPVSNVAPKKGKQSKKKKKKKDPNEPQKPVSAYALFFRDTQATIKGHNPSASFGEVSKIVASMWDQLDPEHKDVYKKKTEAAKKQYLKQLAAYRASQVSQSAADEAAEKSPSPPGVTSLPVGGMTGPARFQATGGAAPVSLGGQMMGQQRSHVQQQQQSPPHSTLISSPAVQQQQQMQHQQQMQLQQQVVINQLSQPSPQHQQFSPPQEMTPMAGPTYKSPPHITAIYQHTVMDHNSFGFPGQEEAMEVMAPLCVRNGCRNHAKENPAWDSEYCSNDCVITHCRDIFKHWVASRSGANSYPVK